jgi:hypothetical protein
MTHTKKGISEVAEAARLTKMVTQVIPPAKHPKTKGDQILSSCERPWLIS